ncbi:RNA pseudouridine synthase 6, chloroplastic-like isoform X4 [Salvia hispanica]|uniref:RNA pseudouridine synthase 6, chloroplastic-like isoform X4 n=1 Tax=Salvia hispanica TaxID=49212 RepID=UPI002009A33C|nr:RNA pseudouridine synthase 6, chloroplastic-like isoform X4 [Salvia hispanica]
MAIGAAAVTTLVSTSSFRRTIFSPTSLARTLTSSHLSFKHIYKHHSCNVFNRNLSCRSTAPAHTSTKFSIPTCNNSYPPYERLLPCPSQNGPPRVEHLVVLEGGPVLEYISKALDIPPLFVSDLIHFGAVFYALVYPVPPRTATYEQIKAFKKYTDPSLLRNRSSIKGKTLREAQKTFRITRTDEFVETGTYLRVYVHPRRFPRCYEIDWRSRIIAVTESYVVLDKPAGTSVGGTSNNIEETCATFTTRALGLDDMLKTTHQIDNCTEGCVVLARTKEYCSVFHGKIRDKKVKKLYLALAAAPVPVGILTHYMRPVNIAPRLVSEVGTENMCFICINKDYTADFISGWPLCQLEVLECKKVPWPNDIIEEQNKIEVCGWPTRDFAYECKINLLTDSSTIGGLWCPSSR